MSFLEAKRQEAIDLVAAWVADNVEGAKRLDGSTLRAAGRDRSWDGWRLPLKGEGGGSLLLLLNPEFPYSLPRFKIEGRSDQLAAPHVEDNGLLCLTGGDGRVDALAPAAVVAYSYEEALALIADNEAGRTRGDFVLDFDAYWRRGLTDKLQLRTWLRADGPSRPVTAWHGRSFFFVAENADHCQLWLANRYGEDSLRNFRAAARIHLDRLPEPAGYPSNSHELRRLIQAHSPDGTAVFDRLMTTMSERAAVVVAGTTEAGNRVHAGYIVENPTWGREGGPAPRPTVTRGFRPRNVPAQILALRRPAHRVEVQPVDAWRERLRAGEADRLETRRVIVIGVGSLGSGVAKLLLQSGLGHIVLCDPDVFAWANVGRHELGANSVGRNKAEALSKLFTPMYPHAREIVAAPMSWQKLQRREPDAFGRCDLILSLTGDWNAESALNDLQRSGSDEARVPIIYGWLEDQAAAAHALAIGRGGPCLRCGFGPTGSIKIPATAWPRARPNLDGCGAPTSIYGAPDLLPAHSLVASLAVDLLLGRATCPVHRAWLAPRSTLAQGAGYWHPEWIARYGDPSLGGALVAVPWLENQACSCRLTGASSIAPPQAIVPAL